MVQTTLSLAKTTRPTLALVYPRTALLHALEADLKTNPAVWVAGPPGVGETTLVASHAESRGRPIVRCNIDEADADAGTFFHYLRETALKHSKGTRRQIPKLSENLDAGLNVYGRRHEHSDAGYYGDVSL